jgi:hypothetical protein
VIALLDARGHQVYRGKEELGEGTDDRDVIAAAKQMHVVVVTKNKKDYAGDARRSLDRDLLHHRTWGLLTYEGEDAAAPALFEAAIETIEHEFAYCAAHKPRHLLLFMELKQRSIVLHR